MRWDSLKEEWLRTIEKRLAKPDRPLAVAWAEIASVGADPAELLPLYMPPFARAAASSGSPALATARTPAFDSINAFLSADSQPHVLLLLSEPGYGKTSLLALLRLAEAVGFWPERTHCRLLPITSGIEANLPLLPERSETVLLLDGLDESPSIRADPGPRARQLISACAGFKRVIIACSNRFFARELAGGKALASGGDEAVANPLPETLLLLGFDDAMIEAFLDKRFPQQLFRSKRSHISRDVARDTIARMRQLRFNPLLLARVDRLASIEAETIDEYAALEAIALDWLLSESHRLQEAGIAGASVEALYDLLKGIALHLAQEGAFVAPAHLLEDWSAAAPDRPAVGQISVAGSSLLRTAGGPDGGLGYRFAHASYAHFIIAQHVLDESGTDEIIVPAYATERIVDFIAKGRDAEAEHRGKKLVMRNLKLASFGFDQANLRNAVIEGADLRRASFKNANLSGTAFRDCRLEGADFGEAITTGAHFDRLTPGLPFRLALDDANALELLWVNPGTFTVGEDRTTGVIAFKTGFWLGRYPVTQEQYVALAKVNPSAFPRLGQNAPVEQVSWNDANAFCQKLTALLPDGNADGHRFRLPKETEWEYACRAGALTAFSFGDSAEELARFGWSSRNAEGQPQPVGQKQPNAWGFHDLHGNVWEWCADWSGDFLAGVISDLKGPADRQDRVVRGGSWSNGPYSCRCANRNWHPPMARFSNLGFRVALVREPPKEADARIALGM